MGEGGLQVDPLVSVAWLKENAAAVVPADCRFDLAEPERGRKAYSSGHIPRAVYFDLERDLSGPKGLHGGRHPLPDTNDLAATLAARGIGSESTVVCYDEDGTFAPRLWWLLRYLGHDRVTVLDGGLRAWMAAGEKLTRDIEPRVRGRFRPAPRPEMLAGVTDIENIPQSAVLIDARAAERYRGDVEPLDKRAGHIPGSRSLPWKQGMNPSGHLKGKEELRRHFGDLLGAAVISSCGSGVTACCNLLALAVAGKWDARLYAGSFSDWISYPEHAVRTGDEP